MATELFRLQGVVEVLTRNARKELSDTEKDVQAFGTSFERSMSAIRRLSSTVVDGIRTIAAPFKEVTGVAIDFEAAMRNANTIARMGDAEFEKVSQSVNSLARDFNLATGSVENATALYQIYSAGITDVAQAQDVLVQSSKAASAALTDTKTAADVITSVMNAYGSEAMNAQRASDIMFKTVELGKVTFQEMAMGIGRSLGVAATSSIKFEELGAVLATITAKGVPARQAMFAMSTLLRNLVAPTDAAKKAMAEYGISIGENTVKHLGVIGTLQKLKEATGGSSEAFKKVLTDARATNAALLLVADGGAKASRNFDQISSDVGATARAYEEQSKSVKVQFDQLKASIEETSVSIGNAFLPALRVILDLAKSWVALYNSLNPTLIKAMGYTAAFGGVLATFGITLGGVLTATSLLRGGIWATRLAYIATTPVTILAANAQDILALATTGATASTGPATAATYAYASSLQALGGAASMLLTILAPLALALAAGAAGYYLINQYADSYEYHAKEMAKLTNSLQKEIHALNTVIVDSAGNIVSGTRVQDYLDNTAEAMVRAGHGVEDYSKQITGLRAKLSHLNDAEADGLINMEKARKQRGILIDQLKQLMHARDKVREIEPEIAAERKKATNALAQDIIVANKAKDQFKKDRQDGVFVDKAAELKALDDVLAKFRKVQSEIKKLKDAKDIVDVTGINNEVTDLKGKRRGVQIDATKEAEKAAADAAKDAGEKAISTIENERLARKITIQEAIDGFKKLIAAKKVTAEQEVDLERKIASLTGQMLDSQEAAREKAENKRKADAEERARDIKAGIIATAKAEADAMQESVKNIDMRIKALVDAKGTEKEINALLDERLKLLTDIANKESDAAKKAAKTGAQRQAIEEQTNTKIQNLELETAADKKKYSEKILDRENKSADKVVKLQNEVRDNKIQALEAEKTKLEEQGDSTVGKRKKILQQQLDLRLKTLDAEKQAALDSANAENATAQEVTLLRQTFEQKKQLEINKTADAIKALADAEKEKNAPLNNTIKSLEEVAAQGFTGFGKGFGTNSLGTAASAGSSTTASLPNVQEKLMNTATNMSAAARTASSAAVNLTDQVVNVSINVNGEIEVIDTAGLSTATANGILSDLKLASTLAGGGPQSDLGSA